MPCGPVDGMNPVKVAEAVFEAVERARRGDGPTFLEMKTYRYRGHSMSDAQHYRTKDEVEEYKTKLVEFIQKDRGLTIRMDCPIGVDIEIGEDYSFATPV